MRHEQNDEKKPFVRLGLAGAHCVCHVAPICKPALFSFSGCQLPAKRNLFVFVQRVVLLSWARIVQVQVRHYMLAISALMVLWILLRSIKFSIDNIDAERLLWYFYYFPMLFIPMLSVFVSQSLGKGEDFRLPRWTKLLYLPTLLLLFARSDQ